MCTFGREGTLDTVCTGTGFVSTEVVLVKGVLGFFLLFNTIVLVKVVAVGRWFIQWRGRLMAEMHSQSRWLH